MQRLPFDSKVIVTMAGARVDQSLVDLTGRAGYSLVGAKSKTAHAQASEYYQVRLSLGFL